jgi:hypothetical protein
MNAFTSTDPGNVGPLSKKVLEYGALMKRIVAEDAKRPGFTAAAAGWAELAALVDTARFERVGNFLETMNWDDYVALLTPWAKETDYDFTFRRISEVGNLVFLELEERSEAAGRKSTVRSLSLYEFGDDGKLRHLDIYLQMKPADEAVTNQSSWGQAVSDPA